MAEEPLSTYELSMIRHQVIRDNATEAELELACFLQFLAFDETEQKEKAHPNHHEVSNLYLFLAHRILGTYNKRFATVFMTTMDMRIAEIKESKNEHR